MIRQIVKYARRSLHKLRRSIERAGTRRIKQIIVAYVISILPLNVFSAWAFTPADSLSDVAKVVTRGGVVNTLLGGLAQPALAGLRTAASDVLLNIADVSGSSAIAETANDWRAQAEEWTSGLRAGVQVQQQPTQQQTGDTPSELTVEPLQRSHDYYQVLGAAQFDDVCPSTGVNYTGRIDDLGRIGAVCAVVTDQMVDASKGTREDFAPDSAPAGWGSNAKVTVQQTNGRVYHGWIYNRSHLLADSLGGSATYDNLITGTRTQNVGAGSGGMAYIESKVRAFMNSHDGCDVTYRAQPMYTDHEIIPRWVRVDAKSCDGSIDESVAVFNDIAGYRIDYTTGQFSEGSAVLHD